MSSACRRRPRDRWLALLLVACAACGPAPPTEGTARPVEDTWPNGTVRVKGTEVVRDGTWVKEGPFVFYDEDGEPTNSGRYELGLETGVWHEIYDDGGSGSGPFVDGKRHGPWRYLHANGKVAQEGEYASGQRVGIWRRWSPAGEPRTSMDYDAE